jgi:hypothetical protein
MLLIIRVMLRPHREPASRIAWVAVIAALPVVGILAYLLFGEVNIGRRRVARKRAVIGGLRQLAEAKAGNELNIQPVLLESYEPLFRLGQSISGFDPIGGNSGQLLADSNAAIDAMVSDFLSVLGIGRSRGELPCLQTSVFCVGSLLWAAPVPSPLPQPRWLGAEFACRQILASVRNGN